MSESQSSSAMNIDNFAVGDNTSDRKSTRLNSSHLVISYAVFCLKKKNINVRNTLHYPSLMPHDLLQMRSVCTRSRSPGRHILASSYERVASLIQLLSRNSFARQR